MKTLRAQGEVNEYPPTSLQSQRLYNLNHELFDKKAMKESECDHRISLVFIANIKTSYYLSCVLFLSVCLKQKISLC